ncbi:hypothetical protein HOB87_01600 [Candidatus Woesearchaeota archaeon]|nr:hypothetical protein [Candidatus Woesearchaeota archaeon]MBT6218014.1 hypothetical protein [Candidatus Neomarinimicrobiota bacterium]MBT7899452.1 hypothetical protein [Candidatus Neomarinimicrobiota bacterium]
MSGKLNTILNAFIFSTLIALLLSGCSDLQEQYDHLKKQNSQLEVSAAKLKNELEAMKSKVVGEENVLLIKMESALQNEKEKNSRTKIKLMQEYKSEFSEALSNQLEKKIWESTLLYVAMFVLVVFLMSAVIISSARAGAVRDVDAEKRKYEETLKNLISKNDKYAERLEYISSKSSEVSEEVRAKSALGKTLDKIRLDINNISPTETIR